MNNKLVKSAFAAVLVWLPLMAQQPAGDGARPIVSSLKGLVFVANPLDVKSEGVSTAGVNCSRVEMLGGDFQEKVAQYLGHPLTLDELNAITHDVVSYYRRHNHPLVDAVAPAQNVESGVIQIVVTEYRVGEVRAQGNRWFSDSLVTAPVTLHHGDQVNGERLINQLDAANTNPFRRVNLVYQPGTEPGYTDLVLETQDRFPVRVLAGFDNSGTAVTGRNRWNFGATWGNALWHDQQLSYQFTSSTNWFAGIRPGQRSGLSFMGNSLSWSMPVRGRDSISVSGSYDRSVPNVGPDFGLIGVSGQASIRYNIALKRTGSLIHTLQFGYDFKTTNNNLQFGGVEVSRTNTEIDQFPLVYAANLTDKLGSSALTSSLNFSPGHLTPNNNNAAFQPASGQSGREQASARYSYWRTDATRLTKLPEGSIWAVRIVGQASSSNLLYTEQLAGGGSDILRGYDPNSILGDSGVIISNELRSPVFPGIAAEAPSWVGNWQALGFWDWAHMGAVNKMAGELNRLNASSVGVGLRYNMRSNVTAKFDWGRQLQHLPGFGARDQLLSFSLMTSY